MMPAYRFMDSYPFHGNEMHYAQQHNPSFETVPPHINVDASKAPVFYEWPYASNFGYSAPCHNCCGHRSFPDYYGLRAPYPYNPLPQIRCCGHHPAITQSCTMQYVPLPHYMMKLPRYEYDKPVPAENGYHCCESPNHVHNKRSNENVKIEEQKPDDETKGANSLVPFQLKNQPYPILWIPPEYMKNKEQIKPKESKIASREKPSQNMKPPQSVSPSEQDPRGWRSWFPFDIKALGSPRQDEDGKMPRSQQNEEKKGQFQFPVIWMPYYNKQNDTEKEDQGNTYTARKSVQEQPSGISFFPVKLPDIGDIRNIPQAVQENSSTKVDSDSEMEKSVGPKTIHAKQTEAPKENKNSEDSGKREDAVALKIKENNVEENNIMPKPSETNAKQQSPSSPKTSKIPPVCLRVDPLPRKNGKATSRSPSPPSMKGEPKDTHRSSSMASASSLVKEKPHQNMQGQGNTSSSSMEGVEAKKKETKVIEVVERKSATKVKGRGGSETQIHVSTPSDLRVEASSRNLTSEKVKNKGEKEDNSSRPAASDLTAEEQSKTKEAIETTQTVKGKPKAEKKQLSKEAAALLIQSACRGYEVRRWEPLKKLKQMAGVRNKMVEVRNMIYALESSPDLQKDKKQRLVIDETIMSLLLKLDTIQGLHQGLRDIRKSLARELINLQDKLDSLTMNVSEEMGKVESEVPSADPSNVIGVKEGQNLEAEQQSMKGEGQDMEAEEQSGHVPSQKIDIAYDAKDGKTSELSIIEEEHGASNIDVREPMAVCDQESCVVGESNGEYHFVEVGTIENEQARASPSKRDKTFELPQGKSDSEEIGQNILEDVHFGSSDEEKYKPDEASNLTDECDFEVEAMKELPQGLIDEEEPPAMYLNKEHNKNGAMAVAYDGGMESNVSIDSDSAAAVDGDLASATLEKPEILGKEILHGEEAEHEVVVDYPLTELPLSVLDEETEKCQMCGMQEKEEQDGNEVAYESNLSEQQPMKLSNERLSISDVELKNWATVGSEKDESLPEDVICHGDVQPMDAMEVNNDSPQVEVIEPIEIQQISSEEQEGSHNEESEKEVGACGGMFIMESRPSIDATNMVICNQNEGMQTYRKDVDNIEQPTACGNMDKELLELEMASGGEKRENQPNARLPHTVAHADCDGEKQESLPASSTASHLSVDELDIMMEADKRLIEENQKLREMMEKLVEAGREQLTAVSNLTERVQDLEKKLSRKKKARSNRYRTAVATRCCTMASKHTLNKRGVSASM